MSESMMDLKCSEFAFELAAKKSVPGGGGAAALVGALGAALCAMCGEFTLGKKAYADVEDDVRAMVAECAQLRERLLKLADEDAAAFEPLSHAYGIPKDDPNRANAIERYSLEACEAPAAMVRAICRTIELLETMRAKGSRMLQSDVGCGALLCRAALEAAAANVYVNTKGLPDCAAARAFEEECDALLDEYSQRAMAVANSVMKEIRG